jgi:hypothetical protein
MYALSADITGLTPWTAVCARSDRTGTAAAHRARAPRVSAERREIEGMAILEAKGYLTFDLCSLTFALVSSPLTFVPFIL